MPLNKILKKVRKGEISVEQASQKIRDVIKSDKHEFFDELKKRFDSAKSFILSPSDLAQKLMEEESRSKLFRSAFRESSWFFAGVSNAGNRLTDPLLDWIDEASGLLSKESSDDHEVLLKLSILKNCDYEEDCELVDNELLVSRWSNLHFYDETSFRNNIFQASQFTNTDFKQSQVEENQIQLTTCLKSSFENITLSRSILNMSVLNKVDMLNCNKISEIELNGSLLYDVSFVNANFDQISFHNSQLSHCSFKNSTFSSISFQKCIFHNCKFKNINLTKKNSTGKDTVIDGKEFYDCVIENVDNIEDFIEQCLSQSSEKSESKRKKQKLTQEKVRSSSSSKGKKTTSSRGKTGASKAQNKTKSPSRGKTNTTASASKKPQARSSKGTPKKTASSAKKTSGSKKGSSKTTSSKNK